METLFLYLIDDHEYLIKGIISSFENNKDHMEVIGYANNCSNALEQLKTLNVDIILMDIVIPGINGIQCCQEIKRKHPEIKVIALTGVTDAKILYQIWNEKVDGILSKSCSYEELVRSIRVVWNNRKVIGSGLPSFFEELIDDSNSGPILTKAEIKVLSLLASGYSRKEVSEKIDRTQKLVDFHCVNIYKKFKTNKINDIIAEAKKNNIII